MNEFLTTCKSEDEYNQMLLNFFNWFVRQPYTHNMMDEKNVSTLIFQVGYELVDGRHGQKVLRPTNNRGYLFDRDHKDIWGDELPAK